MIILLFLALFVLLIGFLIYKFKKKGLIIASMLAVVGAGYFYYALKLQPKKQYEEMVQGVFDYFEDKFQFKDDLKRYEIEENLSGSPNIYFSFKQYNKTWHFTNLSLTKDTSEDTGIQVLRNHIYYHYRPYVMEELIYDKGLGNDFSLVEDYLDEKGYTFEWDESSYADSKTFGYELYVDEEEGQNIRVNRDNRAFTLKEEKAFYQGKSMEDFDYSEYMDYFSYGVRLSGTYSVKNGKAEAVDEAELQEIVDAAIQDERLELVLKRNV